MDLGRHNGTAVKFVTLQELGSIGFGLAFGGHLGPAGKWNQITQEMSHVRHRSLTLNDR